MYKSIASFVVIFVLLWMPGITFGQTIQSGSANDAEIEKIIADVCKRHSVPSIVVAAVKADKVLAVACTGVRKRGTAGAIELSDRHPIGSNTKSMTSTLAAVLVDQGKIEWKTTIGDVWGKSKTVTVHPKLAPVTLDDLLSHQSGLRANLNLVGAKWASFFEEKNKPQAERRRLVEFLLKKKPKIERGKYLYSNLGFVVAAAMMEERAGEGYETLMRREVFKPLGMRSADFRTLESAAKLKEPAVWGHQADGKAIDPRIVGAENPSVYASCGTVNLSILDYARYAQWHLGKKPEPLLKNQTTFDHLHTGLVKAPDVGGKYGSGWILVDTPMGPAMSHAGSNTNCFAVIWVYPKKDFAAIACTNTGEQAGYLACEEAIQKLVELYVK